MHKLLYEARAPPFEFEKIEHSNISKSNGGIFLKIYYIESENGNIFSPDKKRRFIRLTGKDAYLYLKSNEGKKKRFFQTESEIDGGDEIFIEIPCDKIRDTRKIERRKQYVNDCEKESDIQTIFISDIETEDDQVSGDEIIQYDEESFENLLDEECDTEILHLAMASLTEDERFIIEQLITQDEPIKGSELAKILGVSEAAVSQRKKYILKKLKKFLRNN